MFSLLNASDKKKMELLKQLQIMESKTARYNNSTNNAFVVCEPKLTYGKRS